MPRTIIPLTDTKIKQAKPTDKAYKLSDGEGLQLRIRPNGTKTWLLDYFKPFTKKRNAISLGTYPDISLKKARELKDEAKKLLAQDIDPKEAKDQKAVEAEKALNNTFMHVATDWFDVKKTKITAEYADDVWRSLEIHVFPEMGNVPIDQINAPNTINILKKVSAKGV